MLAGFDIGGTKCAVTLGEKTQDGLCVLSRNEFPTKGAPSKVIEDMVALLKDSLTQIGKTEKDVEAVGISCGGPLDGARGVVLSPPNLIGWDEIYVVKEVEKALGVPAFLCNDADAGALAEWQYGAGKGCKHMVFLTFGTGLGAGLILNGALYTGASNFAGELGHIRLEKHGPVGYGKSGSFEGFCSGAGIAQLAKTRALEALQQGNPPSFAPDAQSIDNITAKSVALAAQQGDALALAVYEEVGENFGRICAVLADLLNPERIIAGGVFMRSHKLMEKAMRRALEREALKGTASVEILPAALGEKIGDYAALSIAAYGLEK
ncbi:MAG: ROK family protein [Clostridia bacterium]|nr:ROK family protein [Clostridia bacterium]